MIRTITMFFSHFLVAASLIHVAIGNEPRSFIVIGESLSKDQKPNPGRLNSPFGVDFDEAGNMYIVEMANHLIRRVDIGS